MNNKRIIASVLMISAGLISPMISNAQEIPPREPMFGDKDDEAVRMMDTLKIWKITEELNVDEKLADKLFPRIRTLENARKEFHRARMESVIHLKSLVDTGVEPGELEKAVRGHMDLISAFEKKISEQILSVLSLLTPEQQARYLILDDDFPRKIRDFMKQHRRQRFQERVHPGRVPPEEIL
ncbi:hypothetical protein JXA40_00600 [bacterium]|nr:hypothetical protein [candidate division CSSED10-310 bacterium]